MSDTFDKINGRRFVWRDRLGVLHAGEGSDFHRTVRLLWTKCGKRDIPANSAWLQRLEDRVDCPECLAVILPPPDINNEEERPS